jgi:hypothetical protein
MSEPNPEKINHSTALSSFRNRALRNLLVLPLFLLVFCALGFLLWQISISWVMTSNPTIKFLLSISALLLLLTEAVLAYLILRYTIWVYTGNPNPGWSTTLIWLSSPFSQVLPIRQRLTTIIFLFPILILLDLAFVVLATTVIWMNTHIITLGNSFTGSLSVYIDWFFLFIGFVFLVYLHMNYVHWIITGFPIVFKVSRNMDG